MEIQTDRKNWKNKEFVVGPVSFEVRERVGEKRTRR